MSVTFVIALLFGVVLISCGDSGLDPETAEVIVGDGKDTTELPDLQKVAVEAGFVGDEPKIVTDFVSFRRIVDYNVDTLDDGTVIGLKQLRMEADLSSIVSSNGRRIFAPIQTLRIHVPYIAIDLLGNGRAIELTDDPDAQTTRGGIKVLLENNEVLTASGEISNWASAIIVGVDQQERDIVLRINADLLNRQSQSPRPSLRRLILEMVMELPY